MTMRVRFGLPATVSLLVAITTPLSGQLDEITRLDGQRILGTVHYFLDSLYYDSTFGGRDPADLWWNARKRVEQATSISQMLMAIAQSIQQLDDSHTWFIPPGLTATAEYRVTWRSVDDDCYLVDVERGSDAWDRGLRPGDRVLSIDGLEPTRSNLVLIDYVYHDLQPRRAVRLQIERPDGSTADVTFASRIHRNPPVLNVDDLEVRRRLVYAAEEASRIEHKWKTFDSVAVWRFTAFGYEDRRIDAHMARARDKDWLILDLRGNPGGAIEGLTRLLGHFVDTASIAFTQEWRDSTSQNVVEPRGGEGPFTGKVIVLQDSESASSAEIAAYTLRAAGATILGDRSAGKVRQSRILRLRVGDQHEPQFYIFGLSVTVSDLVMPDGARLEGVGVEPDSLVLPTAADLAERHDPVMQRALAMAGITISARDAAKVGR